MLLAGVRPNVGATTVLVNLAAAAAKLGRRVVVVDAHLKRPGVALRLGHEPEVGLHEVLTGKAAVEEAILATAAAGLHVPPARIDAADVSMSKDAAAWLLQLLRSRFDVVFVDSPGSKPARR